jgi:NADP-dependent 3-hydroxy acid dehydrogenase YdfG
MPLTDQVIIITGASSGIGAGVARELAAAGMRVLLNARRSDRLQALAAELPPGRAEVVVADIVDPATPELLLRTALERFGRCDAVFNGAGSMHVGGIDEIDLDKVTGMFRLNVEAATRMAYVALRHFKAVNHGALINVSSILGTKVRPGTGTYAATKYAIEALSEALRMEVAGSDVRVSVIEPGITRSELQDHFAVHPAKAFGITEPLDPADIARCVRFILEQPPHVRIPVMLILPGQQPL